MEDRQPTRLPTYMDREDPFLSIAELKLSLRQMLTIVLGGVVWFAACKVSGFIIGFVASPPEPLLWLMWSWIFGVGVFLAVKKIDQRPYEEYLTKRILFNLSPTIYVVKDVKAERVGTIEDADWSAIEDDYSGWGAR